MDVRDPDFADVSYAAYGRCRFDLWRAAGDGPAPLAVYLHGGAFVQGDKSGFEGERVARLLARGISVGRANYRFVAGDPDATPFPGPMHDAARLVQYLRAHAPELGVDATRLALLGGSAGANMALWLATQPELADPDAADPVARESTRLSCVVAYDGQTTNDPRVIHAEIGGGDVLHPTAYPAYGISDPAELESAAVRERIEAASALHHIGPHVPPTLLIYRLPLSDAPLPRDVDPAYLIHHAKYGELWQQACAAHGVPCELYHAEDPPPADADLRFLARHLGLG